MNKEYASIDLTSPTKDRPIISARRKLFQRPSIHESRLPRLVGEEIQHSLPAYKPCIRPRNSPPAETQIVDRILQAVAPPLVRESHNVPTDNLPTTQLVNRAMPRKRKQPEPIPPSQRQTRSQAKKSRDMEVKDEQQQASEGTTIQIQPAQLLGARTSPRKKLKTSTSPGATKSKARSNQTTQGASKTRRRPKKENTNGTSSEKQSVRRTQPATAGLRKSTRAKAATPVQTTAPIPAPRRPVSPTKQKRLIVTLSIPHMMAHSDLDGSESIQVSAADRVKIAHRKAADGKLAPFKAKPKPLSARSKNLQAISPAGRGENDREPLLDPADELLFA
ncbi:5-azacytidine resistance azr1 [Pyrenophora seminiperda CCB06]|uniref:5-azacytidine resistance azr1 n=1 Tax=Pyrenophora seminiperda CCB06 TaxID=1302712 RepID=A0A3M7LWJ0_9PLEO|nr:5-azacytidine resistance azr1 [Pyrenophora seminiperda CCB06]